jgi:hypothetical protein
VNEPLTPMAIARKKRPRKMRPAFGFTRQRIATARTNAELMMIGISIENPLLHVITWL